MSLPDSSALLRLAGLSLLAAISSFSALAIDERDYLPSNEGTEWTMNAVFISPKGEKKLAIVRRRIEGIVAQGGKNYQRMRTLLEGGPAPSEQINLRRKDETGLYLIYEGKPDAKEEVEIRFPLKAGQTWKSSMGTSEIIGLETVDIDGKSYENCFHIRTTATDGNATEDFYEAPKVGNVKSIIVYSNGAKIMLTLKDFKPGK